MTTNIAYLTQLSVLLEDQFDSLFEEGYGTLHTFQDLRVGDNLRIMIARLMFLVAINDLTGRRGTLLTELESDSRDRQAFERSIISKSAARSFHSQKFLVPEKICCLLSFPIEKASNNTHSTHTH